MSLASIFSRDTTPETPSLDGLELDNDDIYHILSNSRRRHVIRILAETEDGTATTRELAEQIAVIENGKDHVDQLNARQYKNVYIPLYQDHLQKLDEEAVIDYNKPRGDVEAIDQTYALRDAMAVINDARGDDK